MQTETKAIDLVMLVDDNDTDNFISKRIIEITKFAKRVEVKGSGKAALDYLRENQSSPENLPSLIFLDINMPIVDGFVFLYEFEKFNEVVEAYRALRDPERLRRTRDVPVVLGELEADDDQIRRLTEQRVATRIRTAMLHRLEHRRHLGADVGGPVSVDDACDAAHAGCAPFATGGRPGRCRCPTR